MSGFLFLNSPYHSELLGHPRMSFCCQSERFPDLKRIPCSLFHVALNSKNTRTVLEMRNFRSKILRLFPPKVYLLT